MEGVLGVRKGAWTEGEDVLLKQCIETYGEGNWHQIPIRAGLNRCRKSCRLRWLNYLKPNIKRGEFEEDEVDLLMKLQKLLGNRWSMIAGRLPGRTANDVKNYWNTQLRKRKGFSGEKDNSKFCKALSAEVIRPQPRTFSKSFNLKCKSQLQELTQKKERPTISFQSPSPSNALGSDPWSPESEKEWWKTVLAEVGEGRGEGKRLNDTIAIGGSDPEQPSEARGEVGDCVFGDSETLCWSDIHLDSELLDFLY